MVTFCTAGLSAALASFCDLLTPRVAERVPSEVSVIM
jgi:hypothetical protein